MVLYGLDYIVYITIPMNARIPYLDFMIKRSDAKYLSTKVLKYVLKYFLGTYLLILKYFRKLVLSTYT